MLQACLAPSWSSLTSCSGTMATGRSRGSCVWRETCKGQTLPGFGNRDGIHELEPSGDTPAVRYTFTGQVKRYRNVLCGTEPKNVIVKYNFSEKQACLADMTSHRLDHCLVVDFPVQTLAAADGSVGSGGTSRSHNLYLRDYEPNLSVSPTRAPKKAKYLALEDGSDRTSKRAGHGHEIAEGVLRSLADPGTSGGHPISAPALLAPPRPTPRPSSREKLVASTDADVVRPLPSDVAVFPGETVVAAEAVVDLDIAAEDLAGSAGAAATVQAE